MQDTDHRRRNSDLTLFRHSIVDAPIASVVSWGDAHVIGKR